MKQKNRIFASLLILTALVCSLLSGCAQTPAPSFDLDSIPEFTDQPYVVLNDNVPEFSEDELTLDPFEEYSDLDVLGRCGVAYANICRELMPTEDREPIGQVKPTGWVTGKYDFVDGKYLYNRCHLIGFQLAGENANPYNLITGTRYMNVQGMLPFENMVADYVKDTGSHVLYRVTPVFQGEELVARGVKMEALSVEDKGEGVCFNVYAYNNQPGVTIDYATGENWENDAPQESQNGESAREETYILNTKSHKFHLPDCGGVEKMNPENRQEYTGTRDKLIAQGYEPCGQCKP